MNNNKNLDMIFDFDKSDRIEELKSNPEFQKLPYNQQVILLTGEKLLEIDAKIRNQTSQINNFFKQFNNSLTDTNPNGIISDELIRSLVREEATKLLEENMNSATVIDEDKIAKIVQEKYNEELYNLEDKFENVTQETIRNFDESISDALEKVENLSQFEIKAREEIQKSQDMIYLLEEELARQKEENELLKSQIDERFSQIEEANLNGRSDILNYEYHDVRFETFEDLESFIKQEAQKIAKKEVEDYIHDYYLFSDDRKDKVIEKLFEENQLKDSEVSKVYQIQIDNNKKLDDLELLLEQQNRQIRSLDEDRQNLILTLEQVFKEKDVDIKKVLDTKPFDSIDNSNIYKEIDVLDDGSDSGSKTYHVNTGNILNKDEIEILVRKEAIELIKNKISLLESEKDRVLTDESVEDKLREIENISHSENEIIKQLEETNIRIKELEDQLKKQIEENINLKNDLFDEISRNNGSENINLNLENNDNINNDIESLNIYSEESEEDMKHNYYNGAFPIPGTKITRINNYKVSNDLDDSSFEDSHKVIREDAERISTVNEVETIKPVETTAWQENSQKILDLENVILKQEQEIKRLRDEKTQEQSVDGMSREALEVLVKKEALKIVNEEINQNKKSVGNQVLTEIDDAIKTTLRKLQELSSMQQKTIDDIEMTNKKIHDIESQLKYTDSGKSSEIEEELARVELEKLIQEKYKINNQYKEANYADEIRKIEEERRKIEETLELERIRLLTEIENNRRQMQELSEQQKQEENVFQPQPQVIIPQPVNVVEPAPVVVEEPKPVVETKKEPEPAIILEAPKKKRKQQVFYEIKIHSTPKLTRADLEK
ncbi:hypothetical protein [Malacoplasma iowae]|uniref:Uncharacterized protein n=1 Tax=Malacoplasma iowae 695 TaxID=1048830 RepID=A0A9J7BYH2_MALIO|nr:hypothetical protein [Malacoplasma iowae]VEU61958.1 Uncharacterised protein [Mycoplasmopsis fermentans]EGZ31124.1 cytoskeletal protein [Malacoplasma iowae 695]UYS84731.1 hypothetical protein EER00_05360 [Malacoplasma iowae 695]WPL36231.1 hypothetical protein QX180_02320 [Malacoplasma iowae]VEU70753.1 Uncharacterised protein [Malacoplasma iowae]